VAAPIVIRRLRKCLRGGAVALFTCAMLGAASGAAAQTTRPGAATPAAPRTPAPPATPKTPGTPGTPPAAPEPPAEPPPPPYEKEMLRLSEIMGSLAFLRNLCSATDANEWRSRMAALIDAEATTPLRKEKLAGAYNKGFRAFALTYRSCTPSASAAIERYLAEGRTLSRAIAGRFGG
jgi:uncharacterized protein (TIGR02301 family)